MHLIARGSRDHPDARETCGDGVNLTPGPDAAAARASRGRSGRPRSPPRGRSSGTRHPPWPRQRPGRRRSRSRSAGRSRGWRSRGYASGPSHRSPSGSVSRRRAAGRARSGVRSDPVAPRTAASRTWRLAGASRSRPTRSSPLLGESNDGPPRARRFDSPWPPGALCGRREGEAPMAMIAHPHIRLDARGVAWIDDVNVKVIEVVLDRLAYGWSPEEIHFQHPHLSLAQIHAALAYYYDHQAALDGEIAHEAPHAR